MTGAFDEPRVLAELGDHVEALAVAPGGDLVAAGSLAGDAVVVDTATGEVVAKLPEHPMGVLALAWSADGSTLAVGGQDGVVRTWSRTEGDASVTELGGWIAALAWSPTEALLAAAAGKRLSLLDAGGTVTELAEEVSTITDLAWSVDGSRVGASAYGGVRWYEQGRTGAVKILAWKGSLLSVAVAPSGRWCAAGCQDDSVHVWKLWSGDDLAMTGYPAKVRHLAWDPSSRWLAVANIGDVTLWDFAGKGPRGTAPATLAGHSGPVTALAWQDDGEVLASGGSDGTVAVWLRPGRAQQPRPAMRTSLGAAVAGLAWSGDHLIAALADGRVCALG